MKMELARIAFLACCCCGSAYASQLIVNGSFETGTLSSWTASAEAGGQPGAGFFDSNSTTTSDPALPTVGAKTGSYYALSDTQGGIAALVLSQSFVVPANVTATLSFNMFVNSAAAAVVNTTGNILDYNQISAQFAIVSLLSAGTSVFSTGAGDLINFYEGVDHVGTTNPYISYTFDLTPLVSKGGTFILRFGAVNNVDFLSAGIDNVSVVTSPATAAPEPSSILLACFGLAGVGVWRLRSAYRHA